jgi:predicted amidohydrolase
MRVAAVQFKAAKGRKTEALQALARHADTAGAAAELVVLPEMAATGYCFAGPAAIAAVAEDPEGPTFQALAPVAAARRCWLVAGFAERARDRYFNSALVIDPSGALRATYRKTLLYEADLPWATPGDSGYPRFDTDEGSFTVGICMDLNDDRFVAWCLSARVRAVAFPTNWIDEGPPHAYWRQRMAGVDAALVAANTWGAEPSGDDTVWFSGESAILDRGVLLARGPREGNGQVRAVLARVRL